jgi:DNA-binding response OmpR family regulator
VRKNGPRVGEGILARLERQRLLIAVTGNGTQLNRDLATAAGFDHMLTNPADPFHIADLIDAHLARADVKEARAAVRAAVRSRTTLHRRTREPGPTRRGPPA